MDILSDLLHRARVRNAVVRQLIQPPPWSFHLADPEPLTAVATVEGNLTISLHNADARAVAPGMPPTHPFGAGDIALIKGGEYTIADDPTTPCQVIVRNGHKYVTSAGNGAASMDQMIAPRTFGDRQPGAITMLHGIYRLHGSVGDRLLKLLPALTVVPASPRTRPLLELLSSEAARDEPGQDAVLNRLLDLILVIALRAWGANNTEPQVPNWLGAVADPAIGKALAILHADLQNRWTTAALANKVGMSRAALCARFTNLVGEPPMAYLTGWRMTLAADTLRHTDATVAAVAHEVGYDNAFSFSTAFKRTHGQSPTTWRRGAMIRTSDDPRRSDVKRRTFPRMI